MKQEDFPTWHFIADKDLPEKYDVSYSFKQHEYSPYVLLVLEDGATFRALRRRLLTEENFNWILKKNGGNNGVITDFKKQPLMWSFLPTKKYVNKLKKEHFK